MSILRTSAWLCVLACSVWNTAAAAGNAYEIVDILTASTAADTRSKDWKPGEGLPLEVGGMDWTADGKLAVAIRKGEVWILDGVLDTPPQKLSFKRFASGLQEPLGLLREGNALWVTQRTETTRLSDTDGDGVADEYLTAGHGWNVSGSYHGYAYGPRRDGAGNLWVTLNLDMGEHSDNSKPWRGWGGILGKDGRFVPLAAGMRSPCGLGAGPDGEMFCVDQQGTWIPTTPIYHLRKGAFYLNPEGIASQLLPDSPVHLSRAVPQKCAYPEAVRQLPEMCPPAVWLPYNKMGRSGTDLATCEAGGRFGPFDGQMFVAEFTDAKINRVFFEKIDGQYQGACFPFVGGFASGIVRLCFAPDGSLMVGMTSRGWSSLGTKAYGLQRLRFTGHTPFAIREMRALSDGFELVFTKPVDPASASRPDAYRMQNYTLFYSGAYGGDEIDAVSNPIRAATLSADRTRVRLRVDGMRPLYIHELHAAGVRSEDGAALDHAQAYYTLNRIPRD